MPTATVSKLRPGSAGEPEPESERFDQHLLHVTFESPRGGERSTFGGGETVAEAVEAARAELPAGAAGASPAGLPSTASRAES